MKLMQAVRLSRLVAVTACIVAGMLDPTLASAQVVKCKSPSGQITYTQATCPPGTTNEDVSRSISSETSSAKPSRAPPPEPQRSAPEPAPAANTTPRPRSAEPKRAPAAEPHRMSEEEIRACLTKPLFPYGTEAEIKECARVRGLPSTSDWAEVDAGVDGRRIVVVCLTPIPSKNKQGQPETLRVAIAVNSVDGKHYPLDERNLSFNTMDEAARSGCANKVAAMSQRR